MSEFTEKEICGSFEWLCNFEYLKSQFQILMNEKFRGKKAVRVLEVGCGTSTLAIDLYNEFSSRILIHSIDNDADCIDHMKKLYQNHSSLTWSVYDMIECPDVTNKAQLLGDERFDIIIDKGSLDAMLVEGSISAMLCEVYRLLKVGGVYFLCSLHPPSLLDPLLSQDPLVFDIDFPHRPNKSHQKNIAVCTKNVVNININFDTMKRREDEVMKHFFQHESPLLTDEKKLQLMQYYEAKGAVPFALRDAHAVIASILCGISFDVPNIESDYTFELFKEDLESFVLVDNQKMSLSEMISFLSVMQ